MVHPEREDGGTVAVKEIGDLTGRKSGRAREGNAREWDGTRRGGQEREREREEKTTECPRCMDYGASERKRGTFEGRFVIKGATRGAEESQPHRAAHQSGTVRCPECTSIFRRVSPPRCHVIPHQRSPRKPRERVRSPGLPPADSEILGCIRGRSTVDARR